MDQLWVECDGKPFAFVILISVKRNKMSRLGIEPEYVLSCTMAFEHPYKHERRNGRYFWGV